MCTVVAALHAGALEATPSTAQPGDNEIFHAGHEHIQRLLWTPIAAMEENIISFVPGCRALGFSREIENISLSVHNGFGSNGRLKAETKYFRVIGEACE